MYGGFDTIISNFSCIFLNKSECINFTCFSLSSSKSIPNILLESLEKQYQLISSGSLDERLFSLAHALLKSYSLELMDEEEKYLYNVFPTQFLNTLKILIFHVSSGEFKLAYHEDKFDYMHGGVNFLGRIDRADVYKDYIKIIDYKKSKPQGHVTLQYKNNITNNFLFLFFYTRNIYNFRVFHINTSKSSFND